MEKQGRGTVRKLACVIPALLAGVLALSFGALQISAAQELARPEVQPKKAQPSEKIKKSSPAVAETKKSTPAAAETKKSTPAAAETKKSTPAAAEIKKSTPAAVETKKPHRLAVQVNANEPAAMNLALNNASNVAQYYKELGEKVEIEIVAYGPGLHMLRHDTSPVKDRIKSISKSNPNISFKACGNTQQNMQKAEATDIQLVPEAQAVKSGVVRLIELQEQGWSYIRP
jgi:intracellular sulfur oxidation DsrE/DsrF family protein